MENAILEPKEVPEFGTEFVFSAFLPEPSSLPPLTSKLHKQTQSNSDPTTPEIFSYTHLRDYEGNLLQPRNQQHDYALYFLDTRIGIQKRGAYYLPISGKSNLKRRRTGRNYGNMDDVVGGIDLTLRPVNDDERDTFEKARKEFEEGGPVVPNNLQKKDDDGLSDTDAIGEEDPMYVRT
jgi:Paf1